MTEALRCVIASRHEEGRTPRAVSGLYVCAGHRSKIEQLISELPALYDDLGSALVGSSRDTEHRGSGSNPGLSLDQRAVAARDEIKAELVRIARHVVEERGMNLPGRWASQRPPFGTEGPMNRVWESTDTVSAIATWLLRHVDWLCAQPDADETHDYLAALHSHRSIAFPSGKRRFPIGVTCNRPVSCDAATHAVQFCEGRLVAVLMPDDDRENLSEVSCDTCGLEVPLRAASMTEPWGSVA